jgi:uncharacterized membrane protein
MLTAAVAAFVGSHFLLSSRPVRPRLVAVFGERAFLAIYSVISLALLVWAAQAYVDAPVIAVWQPPTALRHLSLTVMPLACILVAAGVTTASPAAIAADPRALAARAPVGIQKVTRHPVMWGIALWGIAHVLANGTMAGFVLFGGMTALALLGARHIDARKRLLLGHSWDRFAAATSFTPFVALAGGRTQLAFGEIGWWRIGLGLVVCAVLLWAHPALFGGDPWPL